MKLRELDYALPEALIAQTPPADRDGARMLVLGRDGVITHSAVRELASALPPSLLVVNNTRVIPARLHGTKPTGGRVELLLLERLSGEGADETWLTMGRPTKGLREGMVLRLGDGGLEATVEAKHDSGDMTVRLRAPDSVHAAIARLGEMPLPPYIQRAPNVDDASRYQTVFAEEEGAVAAPTAGLHLTDALLADLRAAGHRMAKVTLHVGPGTFKPVSVEDLADHPMHSERYVVPEAAAAAIGEARREKRPIVAVGTTVVRTLEAAASDDDTVRPGPGRTNLLIQPPYTFRVVDGLLTNFHLPKSTLLALVMALGGQAEVRAAYAAAVAERYRFFSYGDAMLLPPPRRS